MADRVGTTEEIILGEGDEEFTVTIRPNLISRQRRFMDQWTKNGQEMADQNKKYEEKKKAAKEAGTEFTEELKIDSWNAYISLCGIALEKQLKNRVESMYTPKRTLTPEYREFLEDVLDEDTVFRIIEVCGGINLPELYAAMNNPNQEEEISGQS